MSEIFTAISNFGFPVVVASYLLFRFENKLEKLEQVINDLKEEVKTLSSIVKNK